jgi:hypothetical protein
MANDLAVCTVSVCDSDISVRKIILVTVSIQFGCSNFTYSSVTVIKKSIISVSIQLQLIN